ncbi:MAG: hypothetical protein JW995_13535 [Melioribacteraceae bacterium]|nr:hypothetical protein [Melioribacteraceae bacterium]
MSFYPQPNSYQCGPFALKHALVMLGIFKDEDNIGIAAGSTWWGGTDEIGLARAARKYNCKMKYIQSSNPDDARRALNEMLKKRIPCILSVNNWGHWLTVVYYSRGKYVVIDSELDHVVAILSPSQLVKKWRYKDKHEGITSYDGYALIPKFKVYTRAKFTIEKAIELMYEKNKTLATNWDEYFTDVTSIGKPRTKLTVNYITFSEFLRRNELSLTHKVANWHGMPQYSELKRILQNMKFVADVYDIIIPTEDEKKALIDLTSVLMMYSCGKYGMDKLTL